MNELPTPQDLELVGRSVSLEDGTTMRLQQIKMREDGPWVTYTIAYSGALPRKLVMPLGEWKGRYGGLFNNA